MRVNIGKEIRAKAITENKNEPYCTHEMIICTITPIIRPRMNKNIPIYALVCPLRE